MVHSPALSYGITEHVTKSLVSRLQVFPSLLTSNNLLQVQILLVGISKHQNRSAEISYLTEKIENCNSAGDFTELLEGWWNKEGGNNSFCRPSMDCQNLLQNTN